MGATSALKLRDVLDNVERILAIELMSAAQGVDFRKQVIGAEKQLGQGTRGVYALIREHIPFTNQIQPCMVTLNPCENSSRMGTW